MTPLAPPGSDIHLRLIQQKYASHIFRLIERIVDDDEFTRQHIEQHRLIVVCVRGGPFVVRTQNQLLHDAFDAWINVSLQIGCGQVPGDKACGNRDHVPQIVCQDETENSELMAFQRILKSKKKNNRMMVSAKLQKLQRRLPSRARRECANSDSTESMRNLWDHSCRMRSTAFECWDCRRSRAGAEEIFFFNFRFDRTGGMWRKWCAHSAN